MYNMPREVAENLNISHTRVAKAEILKNGEVLRTLPLTGGSVTVDADAAVRRRCSFSLVDPTLVPREAADLLYPVGNEVKLYAGIRINTPTPLPRFGDGSLVGWLNPAFLAGPDGTSISVARNFSDTPNSVPWIVPSGKSAPMLRRSPGKAWLDFTSAQALSWSVNLSTNDCTVFVVSRYKVGATNRKRILVGVGNNWLLGHHDGFSNKFYAASWIYGNTVPPDVVTDGSVLRAYGVRVDSGVRAVASTDGVQLTSEAGSGFFGPNGLGINTYGAEVSDAEVYEVIAYNRLLTQSEFDRVGNYLAYRYGTDFPLPVTAPMDGLVQTDYFVPLGVYRIAKPKITDQGVGVSISCDGYDRARKVSRAKLRGPHGVTVGTNYGTAIRDLITKVAPGFTYNFAPTTTTTPTLVFDTGDDPWERCLEMATAIGMQLYFDADGVCVMTPEPDTKTDPPVWEYTDNTDISIMTAITKDLDDELAYNYVVVVGKAEDETPVRAFAADNVVTSPTYVGNPLGSSSYGLVPYIYESELITTTAQAQTVADATLRRISGVLEQVSFSAIVNPAHEAGDVVKIVRDEVGVNGMYVIQSITIPLDVDQTMTAVTKQRRA